MPPRRVFVALAAVCYVAGLAGWTLWGNLLWRELGQDWMVFYSAAQTYFENNLAQLYDGQWMTDTINQRYTGNWLERPLLMHPWLYPPNLLLLLLPFGMLPFGVSYVLFMAATFAAMSATLGRLTGRTVLAAAALLLFPQTPFALLAGQNSYLTGALLIGGFSLLESQPVAAGILLGIVSYKPQMFLMVPVALLAGRHWKVIAVGIATGAALSLLSLAVFGPGVWEDWLRLMLFPSDTYREWLLRGRMGGQSVYACLLHLGASPRIAAWTQYAAMALAALCVWLASRRPARPEIRLMVLLAATLLAAPHVSSQDAVLLCAASVLLLHLGFRDGFQPGDLPVIGAIWVVEAFDPPVMLHGGVVTPILLAVFVIRLLRRAVPGAVNSGSPSDPTSSWPAKADGPLPSAPSRPSSVLSA